jgi:chemotaxis signal transduction protein
MTQEDLRREPRLDRIEVLTFQLGGVCMAADVEQVLEMLVPDRVGADDPAIARSLGVPRDDGTPPRIQESKLLVLRGPGEKRVVGIDRPGDVLTVPVGEIQAMPALIAACVGARPYWGTVILDGSLNLLVDLEELINQMDAQTYWLEAGQRAGPRRTA